MDAFVSKPSGRKPCSSASSSSWQRLFSSGSTPAPRRKSVACASGSRKRKSSDIADVLLTQTYLDLGQRSFARVIECAECGLAYTHGEEADEAAHRLHHRRMKQGVHVRGALACRKVLAELSDGGCIVALHANDGPDALRKLDEIKALLDAELCSTPTLPEGLRAFIYLEARTGRLLGCAITEPLTRAFGAVPPDDAADEGIITHDGVARTALCGISHIWTDRRCRRKGIARALLDCIREHFAMGFQLPIDQLAFSQPTAAGRRLAAAYTGTESFSIYA